ncbi:MAG: FKBP-type peptidyl-prolyl cis-trans isomerase [Planctomycetes bacterium]|nr:FKBP-type peptidyl-prolyl cis-trans isomerase [Planctomycetota bacterium]
MKKTIVFTSGMLLLVAAAWAVAQENLPQGGSPSGQTAASEEVKHYSYAIGLDIGSNFRSNETPLHLDSLLAGLQHALEGAKPQYDEKALAAALQQLQQQMQEKARARQQAAGMSNQKEGEAFLAKNSEQEGVKTTASGLQYKVLKTGKGAVPGPTDVVSCHYRGTLIDGTEFDSSYARNAPAEFPVNRVIAGWTEALQMMHVGDKWELTIPADLAYGDQPPGPPIQAGSVLVFELDLLGIVGK